ncbi:transcriptional regulator, BadM/Rrf2 family [Candidatus Kryptonium thompsonii]|uniref:Transcriptional regulator, BadM/Rrf2 family n=2 Tax=Candidatus Kryptonium thompsonii TaxID=1633631 RepID=A0A0P1LIL9_9BACT|nr:transcriptional regulator, BadM/Rrf2 family [Candidatus Kryptonium thompsoni]CUS81366.1 transcriptional regulator, BadM/Rrf2 family [Candidatus Kryptonium thompsoni]CUS84806.1 transcriptional regulator, BadM/Rrf2 family [Candidatus Kryptonium thompsoni]CUS85865.1 transcriptional regulator, BadM/Rrf2 family [Candidatus Kryptonium thompsoni]CUS87845.1 transcriptional regulator, BadM/Rrf2 family [Candidatus Kryptonium thompsoni]
MIFIASLNTEEPVLAKQIAGALSIPREFLNKVMQRLVKAGFLVSVKGPGGGFLLAKDPKDITVFDIVKAIDGVEWFDSCLLRVGRCDEANPCVVHEFWVKIRNQVRAILDHESLADLVKELRNGKRVLQFAEDFILLKKIKTQMGIN